MLDVDIVKWLRTMFRN